METRTLTHKGTTYIIEVDEVKDERGVHSEDAYVCHVYSGDRQLAFRPKGSRDATFVRHARSAKALVTEIEDEILNNSLEVVDSATH